MGLEVFDIMPKVLDLPLDLANIVKEVMVGKVDTAFRYCIC